jgi:methionine-rich copper-binding protein CopC
MNSKAMLIAASIAFAATAAGAHPRFVSATPDRGATLSSSPREVRVTFSDAVAAHGSTFRVLDAQGKPMGVGKLSRGSDGKTIVLPVTGRLPAGSYTVEWRVAAAGHTSVPGRYRFDIRQ